MIAPVLDTLRSLGFVVRLVDGRPVIGPASRLSAADWEYLRSVRSRLVWELDCEDAAAAVGLSPADPGWWGVWDAAMEDADRLARAAAELAGWATVCRARQEIENRRRGVFDATEKRGGNHDPGSAGESASRAGPGPAGRLADGQGRPTALPSLWGAGPGDDAG